MALHDDMPDLPGDEWKGAGQQPAGERLVIPGNHAIPTPMVCAVAGPMGVRVQADHGAMKFLAAVIEPGTVFSAGTLIALKDAHIRKGVWAEPLCPATVRHICAEFAPWAQESE